MAIQQRLAGGRREGIAVEPWRRMLTRPTFILSTVRSGSTLLRCLLDSHSQLCAPSELHLGYLRVHLDNQFVGLAMDAQGVTVRELEHMLWDRLLAHLLARSGKSYFVDKSPSNVKIWDRLAECWPDARFIILRRNPAAIVASIMANGRKKTRAIAVVDEAMQRLDHATSSLSGYRLLTYEDLAMKPEQSLETVCQFLDVEFEHRMLDYGQHAHGPFVYGIGDWSVKIRSGHIQAPANTREPQDPLLLELCRRWDYFPKDASRHVVHDRA